ncbi:hypothetical protein [uncultured Hymenobacter sp.]|uniref:glycosyl-4,4'-diaponeurosporenoate acyltransferase CrtO family protein n=1 Tax=uncultured Hymenobacter sp. TaxID=170016 RepID=UPI0035C9F7A3
MPPTGKKAAAPSPALLAFYNAVPNIFWSVLSLGPLCVFCYQHMARPWLYGFLAASFLAYVVPISRFRHWQLSGGPAAYRQLGVPLVNRFTQHGDLINRLVRRQYPDYRHIRTRTSLGALIRTSYHQERFHLMLFLFFLLSGVYAAAHGYWKWALLLTLVNVVYNLYPIWLQQYLRVRLGHLSY